VIKGFYVTTLAAYKSSSLLSFFADFEFSVVDNT
jgi:hypothetical protein